MSWPYRTPVVTNKDHAAYALLKRKGWRSKHDRGYSCDGTCLYINGHVVALWTDEGLRMFHENPRWLPKQLTEATIAVKNWLEDAKALPDPSGFRCYKHEECRSKPELGRACADVRSIKSKKMPNSKLRELRSKNWPNGWPTTISPSFIQAWTAAEHAEHCQEVAEEPFRSDEKEKWLEAADAFEVEADAWEENGNLKLAAAAREQAASCRVKATQIDMWIQGAVRAAAAVEP